MTQPDPFDQKPLDRFLQRWRIRIALKWIPRPVKLLDIGAFRGELFEAIGNDLEKGLGLEPVQLEPEVRGSNFRIISDTFQNATPTEGQWDAITMLAVLEHIPIEEHSALRHFCRQELRPGGRIIITVPSRAVDFILWILVRLRLIKGQSLEQHHGFKPADTLKIFDKPDFTLIKRGQFQLGLNNLFVFEKLK